MDFEEWLKVSDNIRATIKKVDDATDYRYFRFYNKIPDYIHLPKRGVNYYVCVKVKEEGQKLFGIKNKLCKFFETEHEAQNYLFDLPELYKEI